MKKNVLLLTISSALLFMTGLFGVFGLDASAEELKIEEDITSLRDSFSENFGEDTYAGVAITENELSDANLMALVTKHFNAVTLGNELKPDAMFGYSNSKAPELITYDLNGEEFEAPKMDFSRAEKMLDYIAEWNEANPDRQIKVRGHVLVWHSQTPEWFFHEGWDKNNDYVTPEEMDKREEWYIKEVLEHFTGKYENLFYGWDVVNEAVSDSTGTYRTDAESSESLSNDTHSSNSSWWKVYQSNQYIINAFKFANKYAPEYVELYYNDYNETTPLKSNGIIALLTDVKNAEGTRIDGMGLQGHYDLSSPTGGQMKVAAKRYAEIVDNVSLTELDLKASSDYDGSDEAKEKEYRRQYVKYKEFYQNLQELKEEGINIRTVTVWGVIDKNSWLQTSSSVGGGSDGSGIQCPLLFDDDYQAKPCFYALCNEEVSFDNNSSSETEETEEAAAEEEQQSPDSDTETADAEVAEAQDDSAQVTEAAAGNADENGTDNAGAVTSDTAKEAQTGRGAYIAIAVILFAAVAAGVYFVSRKKKK